MTFSWTLGFKNLEGIKSLKTLVKAVLLLICLFLALYSSDEEDFQAAVERQQRDTELHPNLKRWRESVPTTYI